VDANLGKGVGNPLAPSSLMSAIPEPGAAVLMLALPLLRRRRLKAAP
jgi:MYXO-CTERM domain-containing protein